MYIQSGKNAQSSPRIWGDGRNSVVAQVSATEFEKYTISEISVEVPYGIPAALLPARIT